MQVRVTRKYQVTIPDEVRSKLGIKIGDILNVSEDKGKVVMESFRRVKDPVDYMWNLSRKPLDVDAVRLVEESWRRTVLKSVLKGGSRGRASS